MKIATQARDVSASGMLNQRKFTVDAGAHIMAVLSGLYKNPVDAMVREYLTNMYDAYLALKRVNPDAEIIPPVLHLPTSLDGNLTFTDYGIGMDLDTVWNVYATYGASTKGGSNDEVGGFGLGSKTAFCYNGGSSWSIESRHGGQRHVFMAFIGDDGVPNLSHVLSEPTVEHSGLTISIPIRREDFNQCIDSAHKYVPFFPMDITVEGTTISPLKPYVVRGKNWGIRESTGRYNVVSRIIMGNVPYPVDLGSISLGTVKNTRATPYELRDFIRFNEIDLYVPIGAVDIVPSRDDLKYTDKTKQTITNALTALLGEMGAVVGDSFKSCKTEWEAISMFRAMKGIHSLLEVVSSVKWNGKTISHFAVNRELTDLQKLDAGVSVFRYAVTSSDRAAIELLENPTKLEVTINDQTSFVVIDDLPKGSNLLTRALVYNSLVRRNSSGRAQRYGHTVGHALLVKTNLTTAQLSEFFGGMPESRILSAATLKGTTNIPQALKVSKDTIYRWSGSSWAARVNVPVGTSGVMYYLPLKKDNYTHRWSYTSNNRYGNQRDSVENLRQSAESLNLDVPVLYGIKQEDVTNFDATIWKNLVTEVESSILQVIINHAEMFALARVVRNDDIVNMHTVVHATGLNWHNPAAKAFIDAYTKVEVAARSPQIHLYNQLVARIDGLQDKMTTATKNIVVPSLNQMQLDLRKSYPMLGVMATLIGSNHYGNSRSELLQKSSQPVLDYVKSIG